MSKMIIYGKPTCPHTRRALEAYPDAEFVDVLMSAEDLNKMLELSGGKRRIPVIVEDGNVTIGYNRGS
ncbi:UXX-star selenoprotein family 1 [Maridesulfovibrio salexigens]|uniref:Glutaredoxin n=1 Tax=Maridesulfovibrio salexigens (strain ATCC 14822 / DSM 2638 / NCIMB 8403 / VKM B-1763) TaxID=526222 RepID=C6BZP8_MARSD|nr:UXX-star (seleno)protein family 1 [Maridesulfovibrio salexigens]ACS78955.1 glutaredoxin [Maridesulfovibrio salexigens DSM 2638]